jgi:cephalosporin-C deacetylase
VIRFQHNFPYDPSYGYSLENLLSVPAAQQPEDFAEFWRQRYNQAVGIRPDYTLKKCGSFEGYIIFDIGYKSTRNVWVNGWLLIPERQAVRKGAIIGHGYGGREQPDYHLKFPETALLFPCFRGLARSRNADVSEQPDLHVVHGIENPHDYILGGCVEDLWLAVTVLLELYPQVAGHIAYLGISFGGGIGALALPWDQRIRRAHFNVPTFGNQPLRLTLPTVGSAAAVKRYSEQHHNIIATLAYYDASIAAEYATQKAHFALALFDPVVAPPGQFAIYNAWRAEKQLYLLDAGHFEYPEKARQSQELVAELIDFFGADAP